MARKTGKSGGSRADRPHFLDLNEPQSTPAVLSARAVTVDQLSSLFEQLDRADELFDTDQNAGALAALKSVTNFCAVARLNGNGRFSRPLELMFVELRKRPRGEGPRIFAPIGSGAGGVNGRLSDHYIKASAIIALETMNERAGLSMHTAAGKVAGELDARGFPFGAKCRSKTQAVKNWRHDHVQMAKPNGRQTQVTNAYRQIRAEWPLRLAPPGDSNPAVILGWLCSQLARAGYGPVA